MMSKPSSAPNVAHVGQIVGAFGLKGQVKVKALSNIEERFEKGNFLLLKGQPVRILDSRVHKGQYLLQLEGIKKVDQARELQWEYLDASLTEPIPLREDEYHWSELIGLEALDELGNPIGKVEKILHYPAQDLLVIGEHMVPAVREFVTEIDLESKTIKVKLIEGL